jgi:hypothetical protein
VDFFNAVPPAILLGALTVLVLICSALSKAFRGEKRHRERTQEKRRNSGTRADGQMEARRIDAGNAAASDIDGDTRI